MVWGSLYCKQPYLRALIKGISLFKVFIVSPESTPNDEYFIAVTLAEVNDWQRREISPK